MAVLRKQRWALPANPLAGKVFRTRPEGPGCSRSGVQPGLWSTDINPITPGAQQDSR